MRIGIDASRLAVDKRTGTENYALQIIRGLAQTSPDSLTLYFNQPPGLPLLEELQLSRSIEIKSLLFKRLWTHYRLSREMLTQPPDCLFVPAHVLPLVHPARSVVTLHDLGYLYHPEAHPTKARLYLDISTRWSAIQARKIIAVSQATKTDLVQHYGIAPEKISVIYHGYDKERFQPVANSAVLQAVRQRYGLSSNRFFFYIGTLQPRKNLLRLLEAFERLIKTPEFADVKLLLGGKPGWLSKSILEKAATMPDKVLLPGYIADTDLPALYSAAAAFVFPSLYEGFGMPVLEALACGCPVVCANSSSLPEVAGEAALYHHPLDSVALEFRLRQILTEPSLTEALRQKGLAQAAKFSWEKCAAETAQLFSNI